MKSLQLVIFAACMLLTISCKKEQNATDIVPITPVLSKKMTKTASVYSDGTQESQTFSYDAKDRLTTYADDDDISTFDYTTPNKLFVTRVKKGATTTNLLYDCDLDDKGRITKMITKYPNGQKAGENQYVYNADGYVIRNKGIFPTYSFQFDFEIVGGNVISSKRYDADVLVSTTQYTYNTSKINTLSWRHTGYWSGPLFGEKSKNLWTEYKITKLDGTVSWHVKADYESDAQGYIVKSHLDYPLTGFKETTTYSYE